jgi:hypothetical protein
MEQANILVGTETKGSYPRTPTPDAVVQFNLTMFIGSLGGVETPAQYLEMYFLRDIGEVIVNMGVNTNTRSRARLRSCQVDGTEYPPDNPIFLYRD